MGKRFADMTPEERERERARSRKRCTAMTQDQRERKRQRDRERDHKRRAAMTPLTPQQLETRRIKARANYKRAADLTPEARERFRERKRRNTRKCRAAMTPEQHERQLKYDRQRMRVGDAARRAARRAAMSVDEREMHLAKKRRRRFCQTQDERERSRAQARSRGRQRYAAMTPKQREEYLAKQRKRQQNRQQKRTATLLKQCELNAHTPLAAHTRRCLQRLGLVSADVKTEPLSPILTPEIHGVVQLVWPQLGTVDTSVERDREDREGIRSENVSAHDMPPQKRV